MLSKALEWQTMWEFKMQTVGQTGQKTSREEAA
jgi:hypothetical protein